MNNKWSIIVDDDMRLRVCQDGEPTGLYIVQDIRRTSYGDIAVRYVLHSDLKPSEKIHRGKSLKDICDFLSVLFLDPRANSA